MGVKLKSVGKYTKIKKKSLLLFFVCFCGKFNLRVMLSKSEARRENGDALDKYM